jgi:hypothetical protein
MMTNPLTGQTSLLSQVAAVGTVDFKMTEWSSRCDMTE